MSTTPANCRSTKGPRHGRLRLILPVALLAALLTSVGGILPVRAESFLEITRTDNGFTIDAEEVSINKILRELAQKADFEIVDATGVSETLAVFTVEDKPLPDALKSLLAKQNHLIVYAGSKDPAQPGKVSKVILMRPNSETKQGSKTATNVSPLAGPGAKPTPKARRAPAGAAAYGAAGGSAAGSEQDAGSRDNPDDFMDAEEEFDRLLDGLDPDDADEIRKAIQAEFLKGEG